MKSFSFLIAGLLLTLPALAQMDPDMVDTKPVSKLGKLEPKQREALKKMILMQGRIGLNGCRATDPSTCYGGKVNKFGSNVKNPTPELAAVAENPDERTQIVRTLSQSCKGGDAGACKRLAVISKEMNKPRASMQLYKMACDHGDALVCRELSETLSKAGKSDLSALYLQKACQKGDASACVPAAKN